MGPLLVIGGLIALAVVLGVPVAAAGGGTLVAIVAVALLWRASLFIFPEKRCYICKGTGDIGNRFKRTCGRCSGSGRIKRIGAGL